MPNHSNLFENPSLFRIAHLARVVCSHDFQAGGLSFGLAPSPLWSDTRAGAILAHGKGRNSKLLKQFGFPDAT